MKIRNYEGRADAAGIVRAHGLAWRAAYEDVLSESVVRSVPVAPDREPTERAHERLSSDADRVLVAEAEDGPLPGPDGDAGVDPAPIAGYAYVRWEETKSFVGTDEAGLKEIYVHPDRWGEGAGTALLEAGIDLLPAGVTALVLEVLAGNDVGRSFYRSRGFERAGSVTVEAGGEEYEGLVYSLEL